jgi:chemotaxis protein histidine kinase CheA
MFLVKSHVEALGGEISLASTVGEGTTFTISLLKGDVPHI